MSFRTKSLSWIAVMAVALLAFTGLAPAQAATARKLTLGASPVYQYGGKAVTFSGTLSKSPKGSLVRIQRKSGASWVTQVNTATTTAGGKFAVNLNVPSTPAAYSYRAVAPRKGKKLATAYSANKTVTVLRKTTVTLNLSPASITLGQPTTLSGTVSPYVSGTKLAVQRLSGGSYVSAGSTTLASNGSFTVQVTPASAGTTTYRVQSPLSGLNAGAVSPSKSVTVTNPNAPVITTTSLPDGDTGLAYSATLTKTGGAGTWSLNGGTQLPGGLTLNADTGTISGTPTGPGTTNFTVKFTETGSGLSATKALSITRSPRPEITTATLPDATQGVAYTAPLAKTGKAGTWSLETTVTGLTINPTTGVISGTTNVAVGTYGVYPTFTETTGGRSVLKPLALKVLAGSENPPTGPTITTTSLPDGDTGLAYSATLTKTGGDGTWSLSGGTTLPGGLSLASATGIISGTPTGPGTTTFTVKFTETGSGLSATKSLSITRSPRPEITTTTLPDVTQGVAYSTTLAKTGRAGTWSITGLPAGLTINAETGVISGVTAAATGTYGVYPIFTETVGGRSVQKAFALKVLQGSENPPNGPTITTTSLPDGDTGIAYSATLAKTGGAGTWSLTGGTQLPGGLTLNADTGAITGTPTGPGTTNFTVKFTETAGGLSATKALSITRSARPEITTATLPDATRGAAYSATLAKTGKAGTWSITGLPAGLSINAATGEISGTTNAAIGDYGVYPVFTETSTGRSVLKPLALHVGGTALAITTDANLPDAHRGGAYSVTFTKTGGPGTWEAVQIPDGFSLDPATGTLTGTPTVATIYQVKIAFHETGGGDVSKSFALKVLQPKITTTSIPDAVTNQPYSQQLTKTGLDGTWTVAGFLPDGITFSAGGLLSGTPTETGDTPLIVTFTETSTGTSTKQGYIFHVADAGSPTITTTSLPGGTVGAAYNASLAATPTGGTWSVTDGSLPVGFTLDPATGAITGTPIVPEAATFVVTYTKGGTKNTKYLGITVVAAP